MSTQLLLSSIGAGIITLWGIAHVFPTGNVVAGFGELTDDNRRIITMEWIAEGLTLCFLGILVLIMVFVIGADQPATYLVARACAAMLVVMAAVSMFTGARTSILPIKLCPLVKTTVATLYLVATLM